MATISRRVTKEVWNDKKNLPNIRNDLRRRFDVCELSYLVFEVSGKVLLKQVDSPECDMNNNEAVLPTNKLNKPTRRS